MTVNDYRRVLRVMRRINKKRAFSCALLIVVVIYVGWIILPPLWFVNDNSSWELIEIERQEPPELVSIPIQLHIFDEIVTGTSGCNNFDLMYKRMQAVIKRSLFYCRDLQVMDFEEYFQTVFDRVVGVRIKGNHLIAVDYLNRTLLVYEQIN